MNCLLHALLSSSIRAIYLRAAVSKWMRSHQPGCKMLTQAQVCKLFGVSEESDAILSWRF
jgi:hypothetical protein